MSKKAKDNNINNRIDRFFIYIIKREGENPEEMSQSEIEQFYILLEKLELNYTKEIIEVFTKDNIEKLKIIIYAIKELYLSNKRILTNKVTRDELLYIYEKCKNKQNEYINTSKEINNFFEYYYISLIKKLEKAE